MITKVQGEAPFQVLTNNFSISPSNEGYTLQISADGENYSNLFTVNANTTRLVTGVAANSYYRLSGNNSLVTVNWMKTCVTEGGGSGSGSTVSVNQILSAGTEIAQITVDGNSTSIYAPEGGSGATCDMNQLNPVDSFPEYVDDGTMVSKSGEEVLAWQEWWDEDAEKQYLEATINNLEYLSLGDDLEEADINFVITVFPDNSLLTLRYNPGDGETVSIKYWAKYENIAVDVYEFELDRDNGGEEAISVGDYDYVIAYTGGDGSEYDREITIKRYEYLGETGETMEDIFTDEPEIGFKAIDLSYYNNTLYMKMGENGNQEDIWERIIPDTSAFVPWYGFAKINGSAITNGGNITIQGGGETVIELTQAEYDALSGSYASNTTYIITDATAINMDDYATLSALSATNASLANKADKANVSANTNARKFPLWNAQGIITGSTGNTVFERFVGINGVNQSVLRTANSDLTGFYAPTTAGNAGEVVMSNGSGAPVWSSYKFVFISQTDYDALATKDSTTIYFITGD